MTVDRVPVLRALLSVSDKRGLETFAAALAERNVEIISTGGSARAIEGAGVPVRRVSDLTGFPEILDGRVKTLHPSIHGGILFRRDRTDDAATLKDHGIDPIDLVAVNLYPFEEASRRPGISMHELLEEIDIGGPTLLRAAAKNWPDVVVVCDPSDYETVIAELAEGGVTAETRRRLATAAFQRCEAYNKAIAETLALQGAEDGAGGAEWPAGRVSRWTLSQSLRYGENPHQGAAFYVPRGADPFALGGVTKLQGKAISYNNLLDLDSACRLVRSFRAPAAVVVKHRNPCGAGVGNTLLDAFRKAWAGDGLSAFGGVIALRGCVDGELAAAIAKNFVEVVAAESFSEDARSVFSKKKSLRLLESPALAAEKPARWETDAETRTVSGGLLIQACDKPEALDESWEPRVVTRREPTEEERAALFFAWQVCRFVISNAIVFTTADRTLGIGSGQTSRVDAVKVAIMKAAREQHDLRGSVMASDAFFPFSDSVEEAAKVGCTGVVQPGGSRRDQDSIDAADAAGMTMVFTGRRAFRH